MIKEIERVDGHVMVRDFPEWGGMESVSGFPPDSGNHSGWNSTFLTMFGYLAVNIKARYIFI